MPELPTNFDPGIHDPNWPAHYAEPIATAQTLIDSSDRTQQSLDGPWHFAIDQYDTCMRARWFIERDHDAEGFRLPVDFSFDEWETVPVPSCWNVLKPEWFWYEGSAVYFREVDFLPGPVGERQFLHFEGANYATYVFLNGEYVGWHRGGSTPFSFEVTGRLREHNRLLVVVRDTRRPDQLPMDDTDWFNYGGLHRGVSIVRLPTTFIRDVFVALRPGSDFGIIDVRVEVDGEAASAVVEIPELGLRQGIALNDGVGVVSLTARPELWGPGHPKRYDVRVSAADDTWSDLIGFREIRVDGTDILLNGQPIMLKGVAQHEESIERGRSLDEADIRLNFALAQDLGCNYVRLAHYPHSRASARIADEIGMLLWEEVPVYWAIDFSNPVTIADGSNQLTELIRRDRNRASVIIWSVGNENPDTDERLAFMSGLSALAHKLDPTRPTSAACLSDPSIPRLDDRLVDYIDIIGLNEYFGWYEPDITRLPLLFKNSKLTKPVIISEFGADAVLGRHGGSDEFFTEEHQLALYQQQIAVLRTIDYVKGISPWILYDFRCPRRSHVLLGYYNRKGLVDASRTRRKLAFDAMKQFYNEEHP